MAKRCANEGCKKLPKLSCECKINNYFCSEHFIVHMDKIGNAHNSTALFMTVEGDLKENIIKGIDGKCRLIARAIIETNKRCAEIIEFAIKKCRITTNKLIEDEKYYNLIMKMVIQENQLEREEFEKGFILSDLVFTSSPNLESIQKEINTYFHFDFESSVDFESYAEDEECFWLQNKSLYKINLITSKRSQEAIPFSLYNNYHSACKLSNKKYFIQGYNSCNVFTADLALNTITKLPNIPVKSVEMSAVGCILDTVYMISGYFNPCNEAYNTITKQWSKIAPCPVFANHYSGGLILDKICITNYLESNAYIYNPKTNNYTVQMKLPGGGWKPVGHGHILTNDCMYQLQGNDTNNWKIIQYVNGAPRFNAYQGISNVFKKGKYLYAIDDLFCVWQIDIEHFSAKELIIA